ncbi:ATP-binding protein [Geomonas sp. RF6]|uniref:ATP-binding protein n=1 Tax=Geomonas sp. RF6 TaxID=2897342 RepID=UPI001E35DCF5|nr:ATP-binding protein [Geomonas sp. RF6]UFS69411.1 ATP-binding protein [Geomonas sp. RF6]
MALPRATYSLRAKLVVPAVAIMVMLSVGLVSVGYWAEDTVVDTMSRQLILHMTASIRDHVSFMMDAPRRMLTRVQKGVARHHVPLSDPRAVGRELYGLLEEEHGVDWVYFANEAGGIVSTGRLDDGSFVFLLSDGFRAGIVREYHVSPDGDPAALRKSDGFFDARGKEWYISAKETGRSSWTKPYLGSVEPILGVSLSAPVTGKDGAVVGVYGLDLILTRLSDFMRRQLLGRTGRAFLTDSDGYLIASSGGVSPVAVDAGGRQHRVRPEESADRVVAAVGRHLKLHPEIVARAEKGTQAFVFEDPLLGDVSAGVEIFPIVEHRWWVIVSALPSSEFVSAVRHARHLSLGLLAVLIAAALGAGLWTVNRALRPLEELTEDALRIAKGEWPDVKESRRSDEIGVLSRALGTMTRSVRSSQSELEERVAQRTADLNRTVEMLRKEIAQRVRTTEALQAETAERLNVQAELREKELMLMQQSRLAALGDMIGNIAHQWRQPLNILGLLIQEMQLFYQRNTFTAEYLEATVERMLDIIQHMSKTIDDFRDFTRTDVEKQNFRMVEVVEKVVSLLEGGLNAHGISTTIDAADDPVVRGYRNQFSQALLNIIINARDALLAGGGGARQIRITVATEGGKCVVTIADTAGGIPEEIIGRIFDPYFTTKGPQEGTGIGLYMAKTIIEKNMGGKISVRNTPDGAEFRIEV